MRLSVELFATLFDFLQISPTNIGHKRCTIKVFFFFSSLAFCRSLVEPCPPRKPGHRVECEARLPEKPFLLAELQNLAGSRAYFFLLLQQWACYMSKARRATAENKGKKGSDNSATLTQVFL